MRTQAAIEEYRQKVIQLNKLEHDAREAGLIKGPRRRAHSIINTGEAFMTDKLLHEMRGNTALITINNRPPIHGIKKASKRSNR